ncbi:ATP-grasp domain-containing protein [Streptomyces sp. NBC_01341]|uniref:ATP-grasp domain-containing protein n=1 Tax=Streptomyces sp. NBC_01341 TaxID=2903831 RepID=UPI002E0D86A2|nr:ATP-grasp domain-containing protein [Streptomyces sp. NBC_01341]
MARLLALAPHRSVTAALLAEAARGRGMDVVVVPAGGGTLPSGSRAHYYGGPRFADSAAGRLGIALLEPESGWLDALPYAFTGRRVSRLPLPEARRMPGPFFAKPPTDKSFPVGVYEDGRALSVPTGPEGDADPLVQISEVVTWVREFRLHLLDGEIITGSQYAVYGRLDAAPLAGHADEQAVRAFVRELVGVCADTLPSGVVVDVGLMWRDDGPKAGRWAVVEANMAWFSNVYAADPARALDVVLRAAGPVTEVGEADVRFRRT